MDGDDTLIQRMVPLDGLPVEVVARIVEAHGQVTGLGITLHGDTMDEMLEHSRAIEAERAYARAAEGLRLVPNAEPEERIVCELHGTFMRRVDDEWLICGRCQGEIADACFRITPELVTLKAQPPRGHDD